jgi:hypothetical protein
METDVVYRIFRAGWTARNGGTGTEQPEAEVHEAYERYREDGRDYLPTWESRAPVSTPPSSETRERTGHGCFRMF